MTAQFTTPIEDRYFEDHVAGSVHEFDPQPFHTDRAAGQHTPFGGVIALHAVRSAEPTRRGRHVGESDEHAQGA